MQAKSTLEFTIRRDRFSGPLGGAVIFGAAVCSSSRPGDSMTVGTRYAADIGAVAIQEFITPPGRPVIER